MIDCTGRKGEVVNSQAPGPPCDAAGNWESHAVGPASVVYGSYSTWDASDDLVVFEVARESLGESVTWRSVISDRKCEESQFLLSGWIVVHVGAFVGRTRSGCWLEKEKFQKMCFYHG